MSDMNPVVTIRDARPTDQAQLRRAVVEIQEYERKLHNTRLPGEQIADAYLAWADPYHWIALAWRDGTTVGVVTVTTMLYVEWGRLGEIGDLYVLPKGAAQRCRDCLGRCGQSQVPRPRLFCCIRHDHTGRRGAAPSDEFLSAAWFHRLGSEYSHAHSDLIRPDGFRFDHVMARPSSSMGARD